ncbi:MAG: (2Fe-2S)-binding protein [Epsilonproteobacteria bacterium]|nr:(2Fe-2S)-binding protein [Campylobacterota bacterium]
MDDIYVVCVCNHVHYKEIIDAIKEGACSVEEIMEKTKAGTGCGLCKSSKEDIAGERAIHLDEILEKAKLEGLCPEDK